MATKSEKSGLMKDLKQIFLGQPANISKHSQSLLEFYTRFMNEKALLSTDVFSHEKINAKDTSPYTVYNIKVKTKTHEFRIAHRYSDFYNLYKKLKSKFPEMFKDWEFPEKNFLWTNFDLSTLETRRARFQRMLQIITEMYTEYNAIELLDFLEIDKIHQEISRSQSKMVLLENLKKNNSTTPSENDATNNKVQKNIFTEGLEQEKVFQFLWNLNYCTDNYITIINDYETYFLNYRPKLTLDGIKRLLLGDKSIKGLIEICALISGNMEINFLHHICSKAFKFLAGLMDYEYNKDADIYIKIYKSVPIASLALLKFQQHIKPNSQKQCKIYALRLLDLYLSQNIEKYYENIKILFSEFPDTLQEYEKWKNSRRFSYYSAEYLEYKQHSTVEYSPQASANLINLEPTQIVRKKIPLTKWLPILIKDPTYSSIKVKHLNHEKLKLSTWINKNVYECIDKILESQNKWDIFLESYQQFPHLKNVFMEKSRWWKENPQSKTMIFFYKQEIEKNTVEKKIFRSSVDLPSEIPIQNNEVVAKFNMKFLLRKGNTKKHKMKIIDKHSEITKLKVIVDQLDAETLELFKNDISGKEHKFAYIFLRLKNFLEENSS